MKVPCITLLAVLLTTPVSAYAELVGGVDTAFKLIGRNHQGVVEVFDDPKVNGVACYVSRGDMQWQRPAGMDASDALGFTQDEPLPI